MVQRSAPSQQTSDDHGYIGSTQSSILQKEDGTEYMYRGLPVRAPAAEAGKVSGGMVR
jgi:hypothetical protein